MSVSFKDYYATLGIARDAGADEIKKAFRKLARIYHPDVAKDKATSEVKFKEINEAYEVLSDPEKRKKYDHLGTDDDSFERSAHSAGNSQEFHFGGTGFSDFFEQYFSSGSRYGFPQDEPNDAHTRRQAYRGSDIEGDILITLEEAMHGTLRPISLKMLNRETGQQESRTFEMRIPPGATDGRRIRVPAQGGSGQGGGAAGDLFLRVRHAAHLDFSSRESDIFCEFEIAPWVAVLGGDVVVPTLDGTVKVRIPSGSENGLHLRVRNRGLPKGKTSERGDFFVILRVQLPTTLNHDERTAWEKLRDISSFQPRPVRETRSTAL